ncbi:type I methionyl aminopeptidase [candidate division WOR-1 bacterium RIFCSPHIGHO2_02_FULL_45_12]|nr:MAG: type I methionyl aminopeptidase [candidate division WOR-1 bacterium RIFCSPHIGHO2_02_FULL_45_12]
MPKIKVKSADQIERIKRACAIVGWVLDSVGQEIGAGITTKYLDSFAEKLIGEKDALPVFIGYRGYKHATCISVNEEVVHGIPGDKILREGDIVSVDVGGKIDGFCGDAAATFPVGKVEKKYTRLMDTARQALEAGIRQARAGNHLGDISSAIQKIAEANGFSVVRELYGHGIGEDLHEDPLIPNFGRPGEGPILSPGMVLAIEPMLNMGGWKIKTLEDGWTVITADGQRSCHFEHTVLITEKDPEILTLRGKTW